MTCDTCAYGSTCIIDDPVSGLPREIKTFCCHDSESAEKYRTRVINVFRLSGPRKLVYYLKHKEMNDKWLGLYRMTRRRTRSADVAHGDNTTW